MRHILLTLIGISMACAVAGKASAATATADLPVSLNLVPTCSVDFGSVNFGSYSPAGIDRNGDLYVICSYGIDYQIAFDAGTHYNPSTSTRNLTGPSGHTLPYRLYKDSARTQEWGDSDFDNTYGNGSSLAAIGYAYPFSSHHSIYATALPGGSVPPGEYGDTVIVTIHY